jgi:hypothetical protein
MSRTAVAVFALCVWVLAGPVAMAFGGCPMMASMCEAPCGMSACTFAPPIRVVTPYAVALLEGDHVPQSPAP